MPITPQLVLCIALCAGLTNGPISEISYTLRCWCEGFKADRV